MKKTFDTWGGEVAPTYTAPTVELLEISVERGFDYSSGIPGEEYPGVDDWGYGFYSENGDGFLFY